MRKASSGDGLGSSASSVGRSLHGESNVSLGNEEDGRGAESVWWTTSLGRKLAGQGSRRGSREGEWGKRSELRLEISAGRARPHNLIRRSLPIMVLD